MSVVYFIRRGAFLKIGIASNVSKRLSSLQTGQPDKMELLGTIPGGRDVEQKLHARFVSLHHRGEWFFFGPELRTFVLIATDPEQHVSAFLCAALKPDPTGSEPAERLYLKYLEWCEVMGTPPLAPVALGREMRSLVKGTSLRLVESGETVVLKGAAIAA